MQATGSDTNLCPNQACQRLFGDREWMYKIGVGGMCNATSVLILLLNPLLLPFSLALQALSCGYLLKTIRNQIVEKATYLPEWGNVAELFMSGINWITIQFIWTVLQLLILSVPLAAATFSFKTNSLTFTLVAAGSIVLAVLWWLAIDFCLPFLMVNYAQNEKFLSGFAVNRIRLQAQGKMKAYLSAWLLGIGIRWAAVVIPVMTVVGIFLIPSTVFLAQVLSTLLVAQVWESKENISDPQPS